MGYFLGGGSPVPLPPPLRQGQRPSACSGKLRTRSRRGAVPSCPPLFILRQGGHGVGHPSLGEGFEPGPPPRGAKTLPNNPLSEALDVATPPVGPMPRGGLIQPPQSVPMSPRQARTQAGGIWGGVKAPPSPPNALPLRGAAGGAPVALGGSRHSPSPAAEGTWDGVGDTRGSAPRPVLSRLLYDKPTVSNAAPAPNLCRSS